MSKSRDSYKGNHRRPNRRISLLIIVIVCLLVRQSIYHSSVEYRVGQERVTDTIMDANFERFILRHPDVYDRRLSDIDKIIHISLKVTADALTFNGEPTLKTDPLIILQLRETNSEGYATFFKTVCTYLIKRYHFSNTYTCRQYIAERTRHGMNLQDAIQGLGGGSPFNRNRDIVAITNKLTGENRFVDPVIYEQFNIVDIHVSNAPKAPLTAKDSLELLRVKRNLFGNSQR